MTKHIDFKALIAAQPISGAWLSDCETYRYALWRVWDERLPLLVVCMLNPSTADAANNDPTIRRLISFAKRDGYGGILVVNLYAFRATNPLDLEKAADAIGPLNNEVLIAAAHYAADHAAPFLIAWGAYPTMVGGPVAAMAASFGARVVCLGLTKQGRPRHPLYVHGTQQMLNVQ